MFFTKSDLNSPHRELSNGGLGIIVTLTIFQKLFFCRLKLAVQFSCRPFLAGLRLAPAASLEATVPPVAAVPQKIVVLSTITTRLAAGVQAAVGARVRAASRSTIAHRITSNRKITDGHLIVSGRLNYYQSKSCRRGASGHWSINDRRNTSSLRIQTLTRASTAAPTAISANSL